jgi:hypothetical protein
MSKNAHGEVVQGIRGGIPNERMEQIQAGLPRCLDLKKLVFVYRPDRLLN